MKYSSSFSSIQSWSMLAVLMLLRYVSYSGSNMLGSSWRKCDAHVTLFSCMWSYSFCLTVSCGRISGVLLMSWRNDREVMFAVDALLSAVMNACAVAGSM